MLKRVISAVIGTRHERERKKIQPIVDEINEQYARLHDVSDEELRAQTPKLREIIRQRTGELEAQVAALKGAKRTAADAGRARSHRRGTERRRRARRADGALRAEIADVLDEILPEAFATVREEQRAGSSGRRSWSPAAS